MNRARRMRGMTLIELIIVMLIVGILATIAVTSYRSYIMHSNRTDATATLLRIQVAEEKFFLQNNRYVITNAEMITAPPNGLGMLAVTTPAGYYNLTMAANPAAAAGTPSYLATATATGNQVNDTAACLVFTISDQGQRTPADATGCWH